MTSWIIEHIPLTHYELHAWKKKSSRLNALMNLPLSVITGCSEAEIKPSCASKGPTRWSETCCVSLCISPASKYKHTHNSGPCAFTVSPRPDGCFVESLPLCNYSDMKVVFFFPHYFWSERETELPAGVWGSARRPRGLEHPAFKHRASTSECTKARDQKEIPSGEKLFYMHWATVMEKSSGEGNQMPLGGGKWQTQDEPCSVCPFRFNSGLIIFHLSSWCQKAVLLANSVWATEERQ